MIIKVVNKKMLFGMIFLVLENSFVSVYKYKRKCTDDRPSIYSVVNVVDLNKFGLYDLILILLSVSCSL